MLENLKIAVKRQKRIILIFFLTIFVPSIFLGVFGIRAIRNERFRVAKQRENEHRRAAEHLKSQVKNSFRELGTSLQNLAHSSSILEKNYPEVQNLFLTQLIDSPLMEYAFIAYEDEDVFFPQFQPVLRTEVSTIPRFKGSKLSKLRRAEGYEFEQKRYDMAISLYRELFNQTEAENLKAQMLANMARVRMKKKDYENAIKNYKTVIEDYKFSLSASKLPLAVISGLQIVSCYKELGDSANVIKTSLALYRNLCDMTWYLTEAQFKTYCSLVNEAVSEIVSETKKESLDDETSQERDQLQVIYKERIEQWRTMRNIEGEIIPDLKNRLIRASDTGSSPIFYEKTIDDTPYLIASVLFPDGTNAAFSGLIGAKVDQEYLVDHVLKKLIENQQLSENTSVVISDLSDRLLLGNKDESTELATVTEFFENNFPPWKIEFFRGKTSGLSGIDIKKSFYFWTIVVLLIVLTFGAALIMRTISHEMEVLKIKSDFVSSVSHEFKTPLTSIRTLVERLQEGKVKERTKMKQYFSVIAQDTDKLTRMVGNILDFSKIDEGKREYDFVEINLAQLVSHQIQAFQKDELLKDFSIQAFIQKDIPKLSVDREALSQALNNLLDNAVKFSRDNKKIEVRLSRDERNVILEVKDNGIGIPPYEWDKIFDKFYQGKNALKQTVKGTGLGLTLVKHTVEAHGGKVSVKSKVGDGSTFSLIFPIQRKSK
ncbi:MAG: GHKL domain-containing protein [Candidatus Aminicenantes bacterium]|nr:MAG: GHKL domain-containing protein [Candidatus Aminicenantes bacterium]